MGGVTNKGGHAGEGWSENLRRPWPSQVHFGKRSSPENVVGAGQFLLDFPGAQSASHAEVWQSSGRGKCSGKIGTEFGNAPEFSPRRPPQPS